MSLGFLALTVALGALLLFGTNLAFDQRDWPIGIRVVMNTGLVFIFVGAIVGPRGLSVLSESVIDQLSPIMTLGFGWIGFLYGTHFEWRRMRRFPLTMYAAGFTESLVTLAVVAGATWAVLPHLGFTELPEDIRLAAALALGICAAGTAPAGVFLLQNKRELSRQNVQTLQFFAAIDDLPALVVLGTLFTMVEPLQGPAILSGPQRVLLSCSLGVLLGIVTHWIFPRTGKSRHNALILLGMTSLGAGACDMLGISPLFVTALAGMVFSNLSHLKEKAYDIIARREFELYAVFLLIAGAVFRFEASGLLWTVPGFVIVRALGKLAGGFLGRQAFLPRARISRDVGLGLLFQGGMPVAIAVHLEHTHAQPIAGLLMTTVIVATIANDLIASPIASFALKWERGREL